MINEFNEFGSHGTIRSPEEQKRQRERQGFCLTCTGYPVKLYDIKKHKLNPLKRTKEPRNVMGQSLDGKCLVCNPHLDPSNSFQFASCTSTRSNVIGESSSGGHRRVKTPPRDELCMDGTNRSLGSNSSPIPPPGRTHRPSHQPSSRSTGDSAAGRYHSSDEISHGSANSPVLPPRPRVGVKADSSPTIRSPRTIQSASPLGQHASSLSDLPHLSAGSESQLRTNNEEFEIAWKPSRQQRTREYSSVPPPPALERENSDRSGERSTGRNRQYNENHSHDHDSQRQFHHQSSSLEYSASTMNTDEDPYFRRPTRIESEPESTPRPPPRRPQPPPPPPPRTTDHVSESDDDVPTAPEPAAEPPVTSLPNEASSATGDNFETSRKRQIIQSILRDPTIPQHLKSKRIQEFMASGGRKVPSQSSQTSQTSAATDQGSSSIADEAKSDALDNSNSSQFEGAKAPVDIQSKPDFSKEQSEASLSLSKVFNQSVRVEESSVSGNETSQESINKGAHVSSGMIAGSGDDPVHSWQHEAKQQQQQQNQHEESLNHDSSSQAQNNSLSHMSEAADDTVSVNTTESHRPRIMELESLVRDLLASGSVEFAVEVLLEAMRSHPSCIETLKFCLGTMTDICKDSDGNKSICMDMKSYDEMLKVMFRFLEDSTIQLSGCDTIWALSLDPRNCLTLAQAGCCDAVLTAMKKHPDNKVLTVTAVSALRTFSPLAPVREILWQLQGPHCVVKAMDRFPTVFEIQRDGCAFLTNSAVDVESSQVAEVEYEELRAVVRALTCHMENEKVVSSACFTLKNYTFEENNLRNLRRFHDLPMKLNEVVRVHGSVNEVLREDALAVEESLRLQTQLDEALEEVVYLGYADAMSRASPGSNAVVEVAELMRDYSWSVKMTVGGLESLQTLAKDNAWHREQIVRSHALQEIVSSMLRHETTVTVHNIGCDILSTLVREDSETCSIIRRSTAIASILNGMKSHMNDSDAQLKAFATLKVLSITDRNGQQSRYYQDIVSTIKDAIERHQENVVVQREGSQAIAHISSNFENK